MMRILKPILLVFSCVLFSSCANIISTISLGIKTFDYKKVDKDDIADRVRTVKTKYPFVAYELDVNDSSVVAAGKMVKILAQEVPDFTDLTLKKPTRILAYRPNVRYLLELPDGKRVWGVLPEASIGIKTYCFDTKDTLLITDVIQSSKKIPGSNYKYWFAAGSKRYIFEDLGWGAKNQVYYYQHHLIEKEKNPDNKWFNAISNWMDRNPYNKIFTKTDSFYQYPRFASMNTRWMPTGWHICFMIVCFIVVFFLYLFLIQFLIDDLFTIISRKIIYKNKRLGNGAVISYSRLLLIVYVVPAVYFLGMLDLFIIAFFIYTWIDVRSDVEMVRCPYCHSVGKLKFLGKSDHQTSVGTSDVKSRTVKVGQEYSSYRDRDGRLVNVTTNVMQRQSFRNIIKTRRWKENYFCPVCERSIIYNKSETDSDEVRVG